MRSLLTLSILGLLLSCVSAQDIGPPAILASVIGLMVFPWAIIFTIKIEVKLQSYMNFVRNLNKDIKMIDPNMPMIQDNFKVCLLTGTCMNPIALVDEEFGIFGQNLYQMKRSVEMYQWSEQKHTKTTGEGENKKTEVWYTHSRVWSGHKIDSSRFHESFGHQNPNVEFPFADTSQEAPEVNIGLTFLKKNIIDQIKGDNKVAYMWSPGMEAQLMGANMKMAQDNFTPFVCQGEYITAYPHGWEGNDIGQFRIRYNVYPCGEATVIGQQVQDERFLMTIRKYNPLKKDMPYGEDMANHSVTSECCGVKNNCLCCACGLVQNCVECILDETVDYACEGKKTVQNFISSKSSNGSCTVCCFRFLSWFMNFFSFVMISFFTGEVLSSIFFLAQMFGDFPGNLIWALAMSISWTLMWTGVGILSTKQKVLGGIIFVIGLVLVGICLAPASY